MTQTQTDIPKRGFDQTVQLHLDGELPKLGSGRRYLRVKVGTKYVQLSDSLGRKAKMTKRQFAPLWNAKNAHISPPVSDQKAKPNSATFKHKTREQWLNAAAVELNRTVFKQAGQQMPEKWRVTCGWPIQGATRAKNPTIGQCWDCSASADGTAEISISMAVDDPIRALDILAHEMVHAIVGLEHGHTGEFKKLATSIGLEGKMTATYPGDELRQTLQSIAEKLGPYPHAAINIFGAPVNPNDPGGEDGGKRTSTAPRKQSTRLLKAACATCGYTVRISRKWLDEAGAPLCPCNQEPMVA